MNFINSILLFFGLLLIGPKLLSESALKEPQTFQFFKEDPKGPYFETVLIRGGTFAMGMDEENIMGEWNNKLRRVTVSSFYMDQYEVSNLKYRNYTNWLHAVYTKKYKNDSFFKAALPDTLVWKSDLAYNEPMIEGYFRNISFNNYPVVGITWEQAKAYCRWRTDRANEPALIAGKLINPNEPYLGKLTIKYDSVDSIKNLNPKNAKLFKNIGLINQIPDFRLPTEAEWEYAAKLSKQTTNKNSPTKSSGKNAPYPGATLIGDGGAYPWASSGNESIRYQAGDKKKKGKSNFREGMFMANFRSSNGDYMGMIGNANDGEVMPGRVDGFNQSPYNIYNIRGNVNEWVQDLYRPLNTMDMNDINPYRDNAVLDGEDASASSYETGVNTLISNKSRVYKGGSWNDGPYWLNAGTRRFLDQDKSSSTIGFRCVVSAFGPEPEKLPAQNENSINPPNLWERLKNRFKKN